MAKTVVLLTASWCPRCPLARELWERLREQYRFDYRELDIDDEEGQEVAGRHGIQAVPTVIVDREAIDEVFDEVRARLLLEDSDDEPQVPSA